MITNNHIAQFLVEQSEDDSSVTNYGYLLISGDERLSAEALSYIQLDFKDWLKDNDIEL